MQRLIWLTLCCAAKSFACSEYEEIAEGYFSVQGHIQGYSREKRPTRATAMLVTDVETKNVSDNSEMLAKVLAILSINILCQRYKSSIF